MGRTLVQSTAEVLTCAGDLPPAGHERLTHAAVARHLARLLGYPYAGDVAQRAAAPARARRYLVPSDTLSRASAAALGVRSPAEVYGGVVPHPVVATKSITHALVPGAAHAPAGWSDAFAQRVRDDVLAGYAAFTRADARRAGRHLLARGPARLKLATGIGGSGQWLLHDAPDLDAALAEVDEATLASHGCVVEEQLEEVVTVSVGRVDVAGIVATYCGHQRLTRNHAGDEVYGGSDLTVVRGDFDALLAQPLTPPLRHAIDQARRYDAAADASFPGFFASRRNYDVAQGRDAKGAVRSGVLEQSWRIGGASGAEVAALHAFHADRAVAVVRASTFEIFGAGAQAPAGALVLFHGDDPRVGPLLKYATAEPDADA